MAQFFSQPRSSTRSYVSILCCILLYLLATRLFSMAWVPLNDPTESRYAEIARIMLETNNWVTPMHQYDVPFWAKPPLSVWLSALSMKLFGVSAFAARLPAMLLSIGILGLVFSVAKKARGSLVAWFSILVLASTMYFFLDAGTVMTDPTLLFCTTLATVSVWRALTYKSKGYGYLFFVALGLGLLAKGPVSAVLVGLPLVIWVSFQGRWRALWTDLPWFLGGLLMLMIALPWYGLAEHRTPGFLQYFIVGEHLSRFLKPGWRGDKYGYAHSAPYGMIWLYALLGTFPWCVPAIVWLSRQWRKVSAVIKDEDGWMVFLLIFALTPLLFFTFARNIIYPYVFPSLPPIALLFAEWVGRIDVDKKQMNVFLWLATIPGSLFLIVALIFIVRPEWVAKSQDRVVELVRQQHQAQPNLVYWASKYEYSASFYSRGHVKATLDPKILCAQLAKHDYLIVDADEAKPIPQEIFNQLHKIGSVPVLKKNYSVFEAAKINIPVIFQNAT